MNVTLYHNPRCSKSRQTLELLQDQDVTLDVIDYLKTPLDAAGLRTLVRQMGGSVTDIVRSGESAFKEGDYSLDDAEDALYAAIETHPIIMQRPIAVVGDRAAIGRPPESVLALLD